jgi:hypothetical protein
VEADETYFGTKATVTKRTIRGKPSLSNKRAVVALVERGGKARTFHVDRAGQSEVAQIATENIYRETHFHTDESAIYFGADEAFASHSTVKHSVGEYVRYERDHTVHTNTVEGYFSVFKRGMKGVYQHCSEKHLHRYLAEFDFRYNRRSALGIEDQERASEALKGIVGKRLTYN